MLQLIQQDLRSLDSRLSREARVAAFIVVAALVLGAWFLGIEFWTKRVGMKWSIPNVKRPRWEIVAVIISIVFICYLASLLERYRKK